MVRLAQQRRRRCLYRSPGDAAGDTNTYTDGNTDTYTDGYGNTYRYSYSNGETYTYPENCANTEASSYTSAKAVVVFAKAEHYRDRRQAMGRSVPPGLPLPAHDAASGQQSQE